MTTRFKNHRQSPDRQTFRRPRRISTALAVIVAGTLASAGIAAAAPPSAANQQKVYASDAATEVGFGQAVAIDGDTALVSSMGIGPMTGPEGRVELAIGSVYVFVLEDGEWTEQAKITPDDGDERDGFGAAVALSGNVALIGAPYDDDSGDNAGSAYLYQRSGPMWSQITKFTASSPGTNDFFGDAVAIDGHVALVSAPGDDDRGDDAGAVYAFSRPAPDSLVLGVPGPVSWTEEAKLVAADAAAGDRFGGSVAMRNDTALIGAAGNDAEGENAGAAYRFQREDMAWSQIDKLAADDAAAGDRFGSAVSLSASRALIGAPGGDMGAAYVFGPGLGPITIDPFGGTSPAWVQDAKLTTQNADISADFGISVALSGNTAVVGAWIGDAMSGVPGSVHVFARNVNSWTEDTTLTATYGPGAEGFGFSERFGGSIAMSGETLVVGSGLDDDIEFNAGAAYFFAPEVDEFTASKRVRVRSRSGRS